MAKSIIVYGVPGGKTRFAQRIADHFGLTRIVVSWAGYCPCTEDVLYVTSGFNFGDWKTKSKSFQEVADEINATISLTDWQSGPPPMVGEYEVWASDNAASGWPRWWNGSAWSFAMLPPYSQERKDILAGTLHSAEWRPKWRGLSQEPIKVTENDNLGVKP